MRSAERSITSRVVPSILLLLSPMVSMLVRAPAIRRPGDREDGTGGAGRDKQEQADAEPAHASPGSSKVVLLFTSGLPNEVVSHVPPVLSLCALLAWSMRHASAPLHDYPDPATPFSPAQRS